MKCSRCSEVIRPVVAFDIDGTLGDYHNHFATFAEMWLGHEVDPMFDFDGSAPYKEWFCSVFGVDESTFRSIKLAYRQGGMKRSMPVYPNADALVRAARESGAEVWLTTTRPHERYDRVDPDTREWLRRNDINFDGLIYDENKMNVLQERVDPERVCFVLDDLVENLRLAEAAFGRGVGILRETEFNVNGPAWWCRVNNLLDARAMVTAHVQDWMISHQFDDLPTGESPHE
jgi:hypothetical protein